MSPLPASPVPRRRAQRAAAFTPVALVALLSAAACGGDRSGTAPATSGATAAADAKPAATGGSFFANEAAPSPVAKMSLVASSGSVVPGERFWLGARFEIAPGWHIYGPEPGDAGMPTRVRLELPAGLTAGATSYPPTKRFVDAGDIVTHGYEREVVLHVPIDAAQLVAADATSATTAGGATSASALRAGENVTIRVHGSWLACKEQCLRETADVEIVLPVGDARPATPEALAVLARFPIPTSPAPASPPPGSASPASPSPAPTSSATSPSPSETATTP